jgi:hypothetical protein
MKQLSQLDRQVLSDRAAPPNRPLGSVSHDELRHHAIDRQFPRRKKLPQGVDTACTRISRVRLNDQSRAKQEPARKTDRPALLMN